MYPKQGRGNLECQVCCMFMCVCASLDAQANSHWKSDARTWSKLNSDLCVSEWKALWTSGTEDWMCVQYVDKIARRPVLLEWNEWKRSGGPRLGRPDHVKLKSHNKEVGFYSGWEVKLFQILEQKRYFDRTILAFLLGVDWRRIRANMGYN